MAFCFDSPVRGGFRSLDGSQSVDVEKGPEDDASKVRWRILFAVGLLVFWPASYAAAQTSDCEGVVAYWRDDATSCVEIVEYDGSEAIYRAGVLWGVGVFTAYAWTRKR